MNGKSSYELPDLAHSMGAHLGIQFLEMEEGYVKAPNAGRRKDLPTIWHT